MGRKTILALTLLIILAIAALLYFNLVKTTPTGTNTPTTIFNTIFPFGSNATPGTNMTGDTPLIIGGGNQAGTNNVAVALPRLRHYTTVPTAGDIISERDKDVIQNRVKVTVKETSIRYIDRATGHIFDIATKDIDPKEISNTTIPKIYEATFTPDGNSLITRFLDDSDNILTYYITLKDRALVVATTSVRLASTTNPTVASKAADNATKFKDVSGTYLQKNIKEIALSTSGKKILDLTYGTSGGIFATLDSALKSKTVLASPLREWLLSYPTDSKAIISTKPAGSVYGFAYILNTDTGGMAKLVGNILGLTVLGSPDMSGFLIGEASESLSLSSLIAKDGSSLDLGVKTLPEKCVWSRTTADTVYCAVPKRIPNAIYPDDWYKGRLFFNDSLWKINIKTGQTNLISDLSQESSQLIDAVNLQVSATDKYLTFINKRDLTLWGIDLTQ